MTSPESLHLGDIVNIRDTDEQHVVFIVKPKTAHTLSLVGEGDKQYVDPFGGGIPMELLTPTGEHIPLDELKVLYFRGINHAGLTPKDAEDLWQRLPPDTESI